MEGKVYKNNKKPSKSVSTKEKFTLRVSDDMVEESSKFIMSIGDYSYNYPQEITYYNAKNITGVREYQNLLSFENVLFNKK